ncbi:hypothetical protein [Nocardia sp. NPDC056000]|uniref:hypothetical protein n=1 Tax=Nocardia sp. NPDC056000 TaxID=3345674 RepID=UPI0035D73479
MTISTTVAFRVLAALIIILIGLLGATTAVLMSRHDGNCWTTAIRQGFAGFAGTVGVMALLYGIVIVAL